MECSKCLTDKIETLEKDLKRKEEQIAIFRNLMKDLNEENSELKNLLLPKNSP